MSTASNTRLLATDPLAPAARARLDAVHRGLRGGPAPPGLSVAVVVADLDPAAFLGGAADFALAIPDALRDGWYRTFTRTVFLAGRPASVAPRHPYRHATPTADLAWYGPLPRRELAPLSRLLRAFRGPAPVEVPAGPLTVPVTGRPTGRVVDVTVATAGVSSGAYLVHVHHLITEAVLRGLVRPGDTLSVEHTDTLDVTDFPAVLDPARAASVQTRITPVNTDPDRLRLYGVLTPTQDEGGR
ncbi:hypothetical protein TUSST3_36960 [Streptomyces sp. TUS-ST3]|jgi:hypothetical protein|uniref:DUF6182 family protein n=1 Tax=Streptomyces sp. TUS-ST3 TaxID=3025591 RepID=UPI00235B5598|nr:DUF6182 family protein [Streptomyces sp. TUS-ST3]GLP67074.1 hypothetical protein TUSST3_36960 [Streptomyces sp. TUS-ST3]